MHSGRHRIRERKKEKRIRMGRIRKKIQQVVVFLVFFVMKMKK